jgi:hypothetical protein
MPSMKELKNRMGMSHSFFCVNLFPTSQLAIPRRHVISSKYLQVILYLKGPYDWEQLAVSPLGDVWLSQEKRLFTFPKEIFITFI